MTAAFFQGLFLSAALIIAIGAQNAFDHVQYRGVTGDRVGQRHDDMCVGAFIGVERLREVCVEPFGLDRLQFGAPRGGLGGRNHGDRKKKAVASVLRGLECGEASVGQSNWCHRDPRLNNGSLRIQMRKSVPFSTWA